MAARGSITGRKARQWASRLQIRLPFEALLASAQVPTLDWALRAATWPLPYVDFSSGQFVTVGFCCSTTSEGVTASVPRAARRGPFISRWALTFTLYFPAGSPRLNS